MAHVSAQTMSSLYVTTYCGNAASALLVYDWLISLDEEVRLIWKAGRSKITGSLLVYAFSRYILLIQSVLAIVSNYPMSDRVMCRHRLHPCMANIWAQTVVTILSPIPVSAFSALRAYALSDRSVWIVMVIILFALPPTIMAIIQSLHISPENLPSPFNCTASVPLSPTLSMIVPIAVRASQLASELLVVSITWWYTYQSYRIRKGLNLGNTVSSLLLYNGKSSHASSSPCLTEELTCAPLGSLYFLFLAILWGLDLVLSTTQVSPKVANADSLMTIFYDPIVSILVCRFMLSIRAFDSTLSSTATLPRIPTEHAASMVLPFGAQPSDSLPGFISSFAHPVHVDSPLSETHPDAIVGDGPEWRAIHFPVADPSWASTPGPRSRPGATFAQ